MSRQGGAWDGLSKPREAGKGRGSRSGGPKLDKLRIPGKRKGRSKNYLNSSILGEGGRRRLNNYPLVTHVWDSVKVCKILSSEQEANIDKACAIFVVS